MNKFKLIELISICAFSAGILATVIAVPVKSYLEHQDYLENIKQNEEENNGGQVKPRPVLESIKATLKKDIVYYANDIAEARNEHFDVVANYSLEGSENYQEVVETSKFEVSTAATFYRDGGDITISYRGKTDVVNVSLVPVTLENISLVVTPYTINYAVGSTFDDAGMVLKAVYNDGSSKTLSSADYVVDKTKALTLDDTKVVVSYTEEGLTKTCDVNIKVTQTLNNGEVKNVLIPNTPIVNDGDVLTNAIIEVNGVYENGNRILLDSHQYAINGTSEPLKYGDKYEMEVSYNNIKVKSDVIVRHHLEAEDGVILGGKKNSEPEYVVSGGTFVQTGANVGFAGDFNKTIMAGNEGSVSLRLNSTTQSRSDITLRCSNSYVVKESDGYVMKPLQINTVMDLTINNREVNVPSTVVLKGCGPYSTYAPLFGVYHEFTIPNVDLDPGVNIIKFNFKQSTQGATNTWNEPISTLNIDYVRCDTLGNVVPDEYTIKAIEVSPAFMPSFADKISETKVPVIAILDNGTKIALDESLYNVTVEAPEGGNEEYYDIGQYKISVELKADSSIRHSVTVKITAESMFVVLEALLVEENGRVYYIFKGNSIGYTKEDLKLFDGALVLEGEYTFTLKTFELKVDVTDLDLSSAASNTFYPHMKVNDDNYDNGGANANGDIRDRGLTFKETTIILNGKKYWMHSQYSMPVLTITNA